MKIDNGTGNKITIGQQQANTNPSQPSSANNSQTFTQSQSNNSQSFTRNSSNQNQQQNTTHSNQRGYTYSNTSNNSQSNYSIRINNGNFGNFFSNLDSNFFDIFNNITGNLNMNIQFNNADPRRNMRVNQNSQVNNVIPHNFQMEENYTSESEENSIVSINLDNQEEEENAEYDEEAYRQLMLQKRGEVIEELNVFQFKHSNKFVGRVEE